MNLWGLIKGLLIQDSSDRTKELSLEIDSASTTNTRTTLKSVQTANRTVVLPDASDTLVGKATTDVLTNKSIDADNNTVTNLENDNIKVGAAIDATKIADGSVDNTEFQSLNGITGNIQTTLTNLQNDINTRALQTSLDAHLNDTVDAHDASAISINTSGFLFASGNEVQTAMGTMDNSLSILDQNINDHIGDTTDAHDASAISVVPTGNLGSNNVQAALVELQTEIDILAPGGGANQALSNLSSVALNADLVPASNNTRSLGAMNLNFLNEYVQNQFFTSGATTYTSIQSSTSNNLPMPSGSNVNLRISNNTSLQNIGIATTPSGLSTGDILLETGNASLGNSGNIVLQTGTSPASRGRIALRDGTQGTSGHVLTSVDTNGTVAWQAPKTIGVPRIIGALGDTVTGTAYQMNATKIVLANSLNEIVVVTPGGAVTNNTDTSGPVANGRDQSGAFANNSWIHFYWIWNGTTLATLSSLSATNPTLPSGYTHFAYAASVYKTGSGGFLAMRQRGSLMNYNIRPLLVAATVSGNNYYTSLVPPNALTFKLQYNGRITSTAGGLADLSIIIRSPGAGFGDNLFTDNISLTGLGASQIQDILSGEIQLPVVKDGLGNNELVYSLVVVNGTSRLVNFYVAGYCIPNGDNS